MMKLPTLYKLDKTKRLYRWRIGVWRNKMVTIYGYDGCETQRNKERIKHGKNVGRSNETTPDQQARAEAKSRHDKKIKDGFTADKKKALEGKDDIGVLKPMLAHSYDDHKQKVNWECGMFVSPKLNGMRCLAVYQDKKVKLFSRGRKPINSVPHINKWLEKLLHRFEYIVLDGEIYSHEHFNEDKQQFEKLMSIAKQQKKVHEDHEMLQYHPFDIVDLEFCFTTRQAMLSTIFRKQPSESPIRIVPNQLVETESQMWEIFHQCRKDGYEGAMLKNPKGMYVGNRSYDMLKVKEAQDEDAEIVGIREGRGKFAGKAIFICKFKNGKTGDVKMKGRDEFAAACFKDPSLWQGQLMVVRHNAKTGKNGKPLFPRGIQIRPREE